MNKLPIGARAARSSSLAALPSVDRLLAVPGLQQKISEDGRSAVLEAIREILSSARARLAKGGEGTAGPAERDIVLAVTARLARRSRPALREVFNLTGTVLHTNLGRAPMPIEVVDAVTAVARGACNVEYDLQAGRRGDRDDLISELLAELTGCEAATVVNNNAAAVLLTLNTLGNRKEAIVSRGEQIEIGGSFRMPDIMARAGCHLREVGTTNRTYLQDYSEAIGPRTALILKVHTSNYSVQGFTSGVDEAELGNLARSHSVPLVVDLGSGSLVDLTRWGLPREPLPREALANGAGVVTFSGDKLLGGPQAGIIVGNRGLIQRIKKNPLKRALRVDKMTLAALEAVLRLYRDPDRLAERLTALRLLVRPKGEIEAVAGRMRPLLEKFLAEQPVNAPRSASVTVEQCLSQIGSGALPMDLLPSACVAIRPASSGRGAGSFLKHIDAAFRRLPIPVIGRISDGAFRLDFRCMEDEARFVAQLPALAVLSQKIQGSAE